MKRSLVVLSCLLAGTAAAAQQPAPPRPAVTIDAAALRRQAAQLGEMRGLLADPDANVRLLAIREIAKSGDPVQKQLAIDAGLSSAETAMQEVAVRAVVADIHQAVIALAKADGTPITEGNVTLLYEIDKFDPITGQIGGRGWGGQIQGAVFTISNGRTSGTLIWEPEAGEFRGTMNVEEGRATGMRKAAWRLR